MSKIADKKDYHELGLQDLDGVSGGASETTSAGKGFFQSNTGTALNIRADWCVVMGLMGEKSLEVDVSTCSYSLTSVELEKGVELHVNGAVYLANSAAVNYLGSAMGTNFLARFTIPNLSGTVQLSVVWHFRGSYSGVALNEIRAEGTAYV